MKPRLMFADREFDPGQPRPAHQQLLRDDLDLDTLVAAMADGDEFVADVVSGALLSGLTDCAAIVYRQQVLRDCLAHPDLIREIYRLAVDAVVAERRILRGLFSRHPEGVLHDSLQTMQVFIPVLARLHELARGHAEVPRSPALARLFATLIEQLDDNYLDQLREHTQRLEFRHGVTISAGLGPGNLGAHYTLVPPATRPGWLRRVGGARPPRYSFTIPDRDESGAQAVAELRDRGIDQAANALAQAADHIRDFVVALRTELGFYIGCLNLQQRLAGIGTPACWPTAKPSEQPAWTARDLYDICLALHIGAPVVGNDIHADNHPLVVITGANRGGKSTLLRSVGLAQLMLQAGMYTPATALRAAVSTGIYTHFKREEDATMESGKLDEELRRMSALADTLQPNALLLLNESFAATNEREGSHIARHVIDALIDSDMRVFTVTHLFDLADGLYRDRPDALFLRADRQTAANRFRITPGAPLSTAYGEDVYQQVFGEAGIAVGGRR
jgi:hypothetical protein